jgi:RNA polymerase sigma-70 factor (ECF subfamily)
MGTVSNIRSDATADELLGRVATGDRDAFEQLYSIFAGRVLGLVTKLLISHHQSEEVCQEVFLEIWTNAAKFQRSRGTAVSWIMTMAHRRAVDRIRASQASRNRDLKIGVRDFAESYDHVAHEVELSIENERVKEALQRLTVLQRQAVTLAYYGGYSHSEIGAMLETPTGTVKTRLRDGMIRLRDELGVTAAPSAA